MNNLFRLNCNEVMDLFFECFEEDEISPVLRLRIAFHLFFCDRCAEEIRKLNILKEIQRSDFFPPAPSFEEQVMERLAGEIVHGEVCEDLVPELPGGFSFRSWVIVGFIILVSLSTSFFWIDIIHVTFSRDSSFLIPLSITVGTMLTGYGAFFIASHLKELSDHFKIH